jgi:ATP-dependent DNA ligase
MFRHACALRLEGIVSKRLASRYESGACKSWVKERADNEDEVIE